ncbi:MAG: DUF2617 family protein [Gemmataceae bacterium]|nr:DUF2617 family protein [Gemmataceae bacterium]
MEATDVRPRVGNLVFQLYDRPVHPELFETLSVRTVERRDFVLTVRITRTGHVMSWTNRFGHFTEVAAADDAPLPVGRARVNHRIRGERTASFISGKRLHYQCSFQVETLTEEVYSHIHEEILGDSLKRGLLHNFRPHNRWALSPLGFVTTESWEGNLVIATIHTFPDERTVVKTQSLIEQIG